MTAPHPHRHTALLYRSPAEFAAGAGAFVRDGLDGDETVLVVTTSANAAALRGELGDRSACVQWGDAADWYLRPGVMFQRFLDTLEDLARTRRGRIRVIGEQVHTGRPRGEVRELLRYDALSNDALRATGAFVLCPYNLVTTPPDVLRDVERAHPFLSRSGHIADSASFVNTAEFFAAGSLTSLSPPPSYATVMEAPHNVAAVRRAVAAVGRSFVSDERLADLVCAAGEVATNALTHGRSPVTVALWLDGERLVCDVTDNGPGFPDPMCGYLPPPMRARSGRGLWLSRQLCDLVETASGTDGTTVRLHVA